MEILAQKHETGFIPINIPLRSYMKKIYLGFLKFLYFMIMKLVELVIWFNRQLWKYDLGHHEIIESSVPRIDLYAQGVSNTGNYVTASHIKKKYHTYTLVLEDGTTLDCADDHLIYTKFGYCKKAATMQKGEPVLTTNGVRRVKKVIKRKNRQYMFDLTIASPDKLYTTNGILSHNSITSGIFLVWYLLNHAERNVMITSQNQDKVIELMDKVDTILRGLPFYMKLGLITNNIMTKAFDNGCKIVAQTTTENTGASFTIHLLYCDEFALLPANIINKFYRTIFPTLSSSAISRMIITSTPRGVNKFYEIYTNALESENYFNPIRTDWYEVPLQDEKGDPIKDENGNTVFRGEEWRNDQIAQLGSEEDFNQEFGNQFLAGSTLLFKSSTLVKLKAYQTDFVWRDLYAFEGLDIDEEELQFLTWHPRFDMDNLLNEACRYVVSVDLADGTGGDYTVLNIFQILPMSKKEIDALKIYTEEKDFFKLVQVGVFRSNKVEIPNVARIFYHLVTDAIIHDNVKCVVEMNHEGNYFREVASNMYGDNNDIEEEHLYVQFKYNMADERSQAYRTGLNQTEKTKEYACKVIKDKVKYQQMVLIENHTVQEGISFSRNKKGKFESQTGHDDAILTCINTTHFYNTLDFAEQVDEMLEFVPQGFVDEVNKKLNRTNQADDFDEGVADILV